MGFFSELWADFRNYREQRSFSPEIIDDDLLRVLLQGDTQLTESQALNIPALAGGIEFIANNVAALPIRLYRNKDGQVEEVAEDPRVQMLNGDTGDLLTGWQWKKAMVRDLILHGAAYSYIQRRGNRFEGLYYVERSQVNVIKTPDPIYKRAQIHVNGQPYRDFDFLKVTRNTKDGVTGTGIIKDNLEQLTLAYALITYQKDLIRSGGNKRGFMMAPNRLSKEAMDTLKKDYERLYSNRNAAGVVVLNNGLTFKEASLTSVELQLSELIEGCNLGICQILNISPQVLAGNAKEEEHIEAIKSSALPITDAIIAALNKDFLLESEKGVFYYAFDTKDSLKADIYKRFQAWKLAADANIMQIDEIRKEENLPPLDVNFVKLSLRDVLYDPKKDIFFVPNTGRSTKIGQPMPGDIPIEPEKVPPEGGDMDGDRDQE